jgi:Kef-type K+ transport system membrane component KefB
MTDFIDHLLHEFKLPLNNPVLIFSLVLFIILLSPILLKKLNIPGIIGLIISGVLIGPHGFNILEKTTAIQLFSTIGLLYIMFIAGLELDLNQFKTNRNKSLMFGLFTFSIPLAIGFPVCYYFLGYGFSASLLTASMFATHTLVAYPIVSKLGVSKNRAVAIAVGGTILTDTAVLIMLAVIIGGSKGTLNQDFWIRLIVSLLIFSAIMFFIIPRIAKWFFHKLESEKHSHYIFVLSVVFFAAFLAEVAGVEPIIGAFVAGLSLNKLIPHSSALMNRVEFIGNALFIPFFLISVGMLVDISVILKGNGAIIIAATLTTVALLSKWLAAFFTQKLFRFTSSQRQLIFGLSSAHAAATLAVILVGYNAGILDENILNGTIILILITCVVASFVTEKAAKRTLIEQDQNTAPNELDNTLNNEHILISSISVSQLGKLLDMAVLIKEKKSANPISILSIVSDNSGVEENIKKSNIKLEEIVKDASASDTNVNLITSIDHNIASGIIRKTKEIQADQIILPWPESQGIIDKIVGNKFESIIAGIGKTIYVCHFGNPLITFKRIVVVVPPLAEYEKGFSIWLNKLNNLSKELSIPVIMYCEPETGTAIYDLAKKLSLKPEIAPYPFENWDDFLMISAHTNKDDLLILISARKGAASYLTVLDSLPEKLEKYFSNMGRIIIYPHQYAQNYTPESFPVYSAEPLQKGIDKVQKIGKGIGNIFKKGS